MMDYFKVAIIRKDGVIDVIGQDEQELHSLCLLDYARKNCADKVFEQLNFRHRPEVISYFLVKLYGDVVFLNTTKDIVKYGHMGILMLPDELSEEQIINLEQFLDDIAEFNICLTTNLYLEDGILQAQELYSVSSETPKDLVGRYFKSR